VFNPYLVIANQAVKKVRALLAEFGMSPSSRSRIAAAGAGHESESGEWMELLDD
jgi:phage terminase small subunit